MALIIKKSIDLSSIGKEYSGITLIFRSIPAIELTELDEKRKALPEEDGSKALQFIVDILQKQFISGTQGEDAIENEDIKQLDGSAVIYCFEILTGANTDPKALSELTTTSSTDPK